MARSERATGEIDEYPTDSHTQSFAFYRAVQRCIRARRQYPPDPNLRQAVRETLNLPVGAHITQADMRELTALNARDSQITDLTGL
jgi:hypothetical protein